MTTLREAATQALEALEMARMNGEAGLHKYETLQIAESAEALRAALAEPVQEPDVPETNFGNMEPVAWRWRMRNLTDAPGFVQPWTVTTYYPREQANEIEPLYTAPPQRKPLTEEEIQQCFKEAGITIVGEAWTKAIRAIERAHGIT